MLASPLLLTRAGTGSPGQTHASILGEASGSRLGALGAFGGGGWGGHWIIRIKKRGGKARKKRGRVEKGKNWGRLGGGDFEGHFE